MGRPRNRVLAGCLLGLWLTGCGGGLRLGSVSGRVTVHGQPVPAGTILFHPADGPTAVGAIGPDGAYTLTTLRSNDGAVVGSHRVTIQATAVGAGSLVDPKSLDAEVKLSRQGGKVLVAGKVSWLVPEKYSRLDTSGLTAQVEPGANAIDFDIPGP